MALRGESSSPPSPSAPLRALGDLCGSSSIAFSPSADQLHQVLNDLVCPYASLDDVAKNNGTTVYALSAWMALAETQTMLDQIEQAAYRRARVSAACNLTDAVNSLSFTLRAHVSAETNEPLGRSTEALNIRQRQRTDARKASWLLFRIARAYPAIPIDPNTLRFINTLKRERDEQRDALGRSALRADASDFDGSVRSALRADARVPLTRFGSVPFESAEPDSTEPVPHDSCATGCLPTSANDDTPSATISPSSSSPPSQPLHAAGALRDLPLASSLQDDANSSRVACLLKEQACSGELALSPTPDDPHGCSRAAMPPDQPDSTASPFVPTSPCPSAPSPASPPRSYALSASSAFSSHRAPHARGDPAA